MTVRTAVNDDLEIVADLWLDLANLNAGLDDRFAPPRAGRDEAVVSWLENSLHDSDSLLLVAEVGGRVAGFVRGEVRRTPPPFRPRRLGAITDLWVTTPHRRQGLGRQLVEAAMDHFERLAVEGVRIGVAVRNPVADAFWDKLGFEPFVQSRFRALAPGDTR